MAASSVASSASSVTILASSTGARRYATVFNDSTAILYLLLDSGTASTTNYTVQVPAAGYFETPALYRGQLTGIWAAANGFARVTELV
jgi:hypothetical protein